MSFTNISQLKDDIFRENFLFNPAEYGRIYVFIDFANVRYWSKEFWPEDNKEYFKREIDIKKLAEIINLIKPTKKFFYYGFFKEWSELPDEHELNIKHRGSKYRLSKAEKCGFRIRSKEIKEIKNFDEEGHLLGKINKCNFDVEITFDLLTKIEKYDTAFLWSGDSDFDFPVKYLKSKGKKVLVACARNFISDELYSVANLFIPADPLKAYLELEKDMKTSTPARGGGHKDNPDIPQVGAV